LKVLVEKTDETTFKRNCQADSVDLEPDGGRQESEQTLRKPDLADKRNIRVEAGGRSFHVRVAPAKADTDDKIPAEKQAKVGNDRQASRRENEPTATKAAFANKRVMRMEAGGGSFHVRVAPDKEQTDNDSAEKKAVKKNVNTNRKREGVRENKRVIQMEAGGRFFHVRVAPKNDDAAVDKELQPDNKPRQETEKKAAFANKRVVRMEAGGGSFHVRRVARTKNKGDDDVLLQAQSDQQVNKATKDEKADAVHHEDDGTGKRSRRLRVGLRHTHAEDGQQEEGNTLLYSRLEHRGTSLSYMKKYHRQETDEEGEEEEGKEKSHAYFTAEEEIEASEAGYKHGVVQIVEPDGGEDDEEEDVTSEQEAVSVVDEEDAEEETASRAAGEEGQTNETTENSSANKDLYSSSFCVSCLLIMFVFLKICFVRIYCILYHIP
jgi:hypothetical protein